MNPVVVSAQFAAYIWFREGKPDTRANRAAAKRFCRENWISFLPNAHRGLGRLLMKIARPQLPFRSRAPQCRRVIRPFTIRAAVAV